MNRLEGMMACVALTGAVLYGPAQKAAHSLQGSAAVGRAASFVRAQVTRPAPPADIPVQIFAAVEPPIPPEPPVTASCFRERATQQAIERTQREIARHQRTIAFVQSEEFQRQQSRLVNEKVRLAMMQAKWRKGFGE